MIELNDKTRQDFLDRKWVQMLLDAGVDMSDAKYCICKHLETTGLKGDYVYLLKDAKDNIYITDNIPTYTVSELLYKLHEWIYPTINGVEYAGGLRMTKDAPFYPAYYHLTAKDDPDKWDESFMAEAEYPIESLASLLIQCHKRDIGIKRIQETSVINDLRATLRKADSVK